MMRKIEYQPADSVDTASLEALDVSLDVSEVNGELEIERLMSENADSFTDPPKSRVNSICEIGTPAGEGEDGDPANLDTPSGNSQPFNVEPEIVEEIPYSKTAEKTEKDGSHTHLPETETSGWLPSN